MTAAAYNLKKYLKFEKKNNQPQRGSVKNEIKRLAYLFMPPLTFIESILKSYSKIEFSFRLNLTN